MECELGVRELLQSAIKAEVAANPLTNGMEDGQSYRDEPARTSALDAIGRKFASLLYTVKPGGEEIVTRFSPSEEAVNSYSRQSADTRQSAETAYQKSSKNAPKEATIEDIAAGLRARIKSDVDTLAKYAETILVTAKRISNAAKRQSNTEEAMSEIWTTLQQDPDHVPKLMTVAHFISEARAFMSEARKRIDALDKDDPETKDQVAMLVNEITMTLDQYAPIITEFHKDLSKADPENPVKKVIDAAHSDMTAIQALSTKVNEDVAIAELLRVLEPSMLRAQAVVEKQIRTLEERLDKVKESERIAINKKIARLKQEFDELAPTAKNVRASLLGGAADSSQIAKFMLAGAMNSDLLVQGFMRIIKEKLQSAQQEYMEIGAEMGERFNALLDTGFSVANLEEAFKDLHTEVTEYHYDDATKEVVETKGVFFVSETDQSWRTEFTKLKANLTKLGRSILDARREGKPADEIRKMEVQYDKDKTEYMKWRRENFETEYGDRYQAADAMLDQMVNFRGTQMSLREIRSSYYDQISRIQEQVAALTGVPSPNDVAEMNRLRLEFEAVRSTEGKEGEDLRIAQIFQDHALEMREMTDRWEASAASLDRFNMRKAKIDKEFEAGEIDKEERDRWYAANTTTVYNQKYWVERKNTVGTLNAIAEEMSRITGVTIGSPLKANYERMESIAKKYRDHNSHIDGRKLTPSERATMLSIEEEIEATKREMESAYSAFLGAEFEDVYQDMKAEAQTLLDQKEDLRRDDPSNSITTRQKIKDINRRLRELRDNEGKLAKKFLKDKGISDADIKAFQDLFKKYRGAVKHLSGLTESTETEYYYETFQSELNKFVAGKSQAERDARIAKVSNIKIGKINYQKKNGIFYETYFDGTLSTDPTPPEAIIDHLFRKEFENSDWYKANHFLAQRWVSGEPVERMVPIYAWRISKPSDKRWIKEHAPNISWKRRVIKDEYKNPNYGTGLDGMPKLKAGLHDNTEYAALRAKNPALWEFRDFMIDEYLTSQREYPEGQAMGLRVPTIEKDTSGYSLFQRGFTGYGRQIGRDYTLNAQDADEGMFVNADEKGRERKIIPIKFQGKMDADLVSRNIVETIGQYAGQARMYRARKELLNIGKAIESTLAFEGHTPSSQSFDKTAKAFGVFRRNKKQGENERLDTVRNMIDTFIYGENTVERSKLGQKLHKWMSNLLGVRAMMLFSELPSIVSWAVGGAGDVGATGWSQLVNKIGGETQMIIKSLIGRGVEANGESVGAGFNFSDYLWANKEYTTNAVSFLSDVGKVSNRSFWTEFADFFDARELSYIDNFGKQLYSKGLLRQVNLNNLAFFKNVVEHELMMKVIMSFGKGYHINTPDGKVALKDAFTVEGGRLVPKYEISDAEITKIRGYVAALLRDVNGNYGKLDKLDVERYALGRSLMFLRKWLVPMVIARYGSQRYSVEQDRVVRGYIWESMLLTKDAFLGFNETGFRGLGSILLPEISVNLTEAEKTALKQTRVEIGLIMLMWVMYRFVLGYDDEDEDRFKDLEKDPYFLQGLTYSLVKANSEQSIFMPVMGFDEAVKIGSNPLSNSAPIVGDLFNIIKDDIDWSLDPTEISFKEYKRDSGTNEKGDLKAAAHLWKLAGLTTVKQDPVEALRVLEYSLNKHK